MDNSDLKIKKLDNLITHKFSHVVDMYMNLFPINETRPIDKTIKMLVGDKNYSLYVVESSSRVIAFAMVYKWKKYSLLDYFGVHKNMQEKGIGRLFFNKLVDILCKNEKILLLEVNDDKIEFYKNQNAIILLDKYIMPSYNKNPKTMSLMSVGNLNEDVKKRKINKYVKSIYNDVYKIKKIKN